MKMNAEEMIMVQFKDILGKMRMITIKNVCHSESKFVVRHAY